MTSPIRLRASAALKMDHEPEERRAMVRVARMATEPAISDPTGPPPSEDRLQPAAATRRPATVWQQTLQATTGWMCLAPFLLVSPFLWNPPFWISMLSQLPERGSRR